MPRWQEEKMSDKFVVQIEVIETPGKNALYINGYRVAGSKPWGGGRTIEQWNVKHSELVKILDDTQAAARIAELEKDLDGVKEARDELQAVFNKCWEADQRAIKAWQEAHPGTDLVWPDRTKVTVWLLEKGNAASARIAELEAALLSAKQHFVADEPLKAFVEICVGLGEQE